MEPNTYDKIQALVNSMREDHLKCFNKNNSSAGIRLRKSIKTLKELADKYRKESLKN